MFNAVKESTKVSVGASCGHEEMKEESVSNLSIEASSFSCFVGGRGVGEKRGGRIFVYLFQ